MEICELVIKADSKNAINRRILSYINANYETLIYDRHLLFKYILISGRKRHKGVTKCPTLLVDQQRIEGEDIISFLKKQPAKRPRKSSANNELSGYMDQVIMDTGDLSGAPDRMDTPDHDRRLAEFIAGRAPQSDKKNQRIPTKYDSLIRKIDSGGGGPSGDDRGAPMDADYADDFMGGDVGPMDDDYQAYAAAIAGSTSGVMA